jgi:Asp/Glu/hydantoin racemase
MRILLVLNGPRERYTGGSAEARLEVWSRYLSPGTDLEIGYLAGEKDGGRAGTYEFGTSEAPLKHAELYPDRCVEAEQEGYNAVIMHCCSDPGLHEARRRVTIPVIGPGEATLRAGAILGRSIGMTVPSRESAAHHWQQIRDVGVIKQVIGIEVVETTIGDYRTQDPVAMTDAVVAAAEKLVAKGADVICPTGLAILPVRVSAREVSERIGIPVVDPALVAVRSVENLIEATAKSIAL